MAATSDKDSMTAGLDRLEGQVVGVGRVDRPDDLNDLNNKRADAATGALALYMEHKGQARKLAETDWASLLATLAEVDEQSRPLIEEVSIALEVRQSSGATIKVQVTGLQAEQIKETVEIGDRIVGEGVSGEEEFLLETYEVYKLAAGSGGRVIAAVEPVIEQDQVDAMAEVNEGDEDATGPGPAA